MGLRIAPDIYTTLVSSVNQDQTNLNNALQQVSSGQSLNQLSDNPLAASELVGNRTEISNNDQYLHSISYVQGALQTGDSTLNSVINSLNQALSLGTEGANGTLSDSERQAVAQQISSIQQTVLGLANTSYQGSYLFAGTATSQPPYVQDSTSPSGVTYQGNGNTNQVAIGANQTAPINLPGSSIFNAPGADVFQALNDLQNALNINGNISGATSEVSAALQSVDAQRTFYGNTVDEMNTATTDLNSEQLQLQQQQNTLIAANPAQAISNMEQADTTLQAALSAFAKISQNTLLDYLK
jgi:flagellar hook-associated protein 3 FlgL